MGITMGFIAVTLEQQATVLAEPDRWHEIEEDRVGLGDSDEELTCDVDKAWDGLRFLLRAAKVPVHLECTHYPADGGYAVRGWSPDEVQVAAEHLRATPFERLASHFDPQGMTRSDVYPSQIWECEGDEALAYLRVHYEDLVRFFDAAVRSGAAVLQRMD